MGLGSIGQDIRYGLRQLRRSPGFTFTVVGVLALGIGANAAMFTVLDGTLLRRLPYRAAGELVSLESIDPHGRVNQNQLADVMEWQRDNKTLDGVAYYEEDAGVVDGGAGDHEVLKTRVSANLLDVLGAAPAMGRGFLPEEQQAGRDAEVVLSDAVWREHFGAAPDILGKVVKIDDAPVTVVGVMPRGFMFPVSQSVRRPAPQVWVPVGISPKTLSRDFDAGWFATIARLRKGIAETAAQRDLSAIQEKSALFYKEEMRASFAPVKVQVSGYRSGLVKDQRPALLALMCAVGVVWLIACANVANLMLARSTVRRREMAVRGALGASAWRLVRQMMIESVMLSLAGAGAGVGLAWGTLKGFQKVIETSLGGGVGAAPDLRVLGALLGLSVLSAIIFGVAPALLGVRVSLDQTLRSGGSQAGSGRGQHRAQRTLVVAEIALSLVMLVACGLLLRTVFALRNVPLGFRTDHVYVVSPQLPGFKYKVADVHQVVYKPLLERVRAMHGVEAAALTTIMPLSKGFHVAFSLNVNNTTKEAKNVKKPAQVVNATLKAAGPELQKVLGFEMAKGRYFNDQDTANSEPVVVVNEAFAKKYEGLQGQVMDKFKLGVGEKRQARIIGVIKDFHQAGIAEAAVPEIDLCTSQMLPGDNLYQPTLKVKEELAIRVNGDTKGFVPDLERVMKDVNPDLQGGLIRTMDQVVEDAMASQLLAAHLLEALGVLALAVALAGLYSLLAYLVTLRTREMGVRMALGAAREDILRLVMRQAGWMVAGGIVVGVAVSLGTAQMLQHFLFGVKARDLSTVIVAAFLMATVAGVAAYLPARRASEIEPMEALRME